VGILRAIDQHSAVPSVTLAPGVMLPAVAGVYARVLQGGLLRRGDALWLAS
jgi:MOSC domain-containing protein YiiM